MATALEKWIAKLNETSRYWTASAEFICRDGKIVSVKWKEFTFKGDEDEGESK